MSLADLNIQPIVNDAQNGPIYILHIDVGGDIRISIDCCGNLSAGGFRLCASSRLRNDIMLPDFFFETPCVCTTQRVNFSPILEKLKGRPDS